MLEAAVASDTERLAVLASKPPAACGHINPEGSNVVSFSNNIVRYRPNDNK